MSRTTMHKGSPNMHCTKPHNSDFVNLFYDATTDSQWGPSVFLMSALAVGTYTPRVFQEITDCLLNRLRDKKKLRKLEKSVTVLEYLILCGPEQFRRVFKKNRSVLDRLLRWNIDRKEGNPEMFKEKLEHIISLLGEDALYAGERAKALYTEMDMCRFCLEQRIDIGAQNPKSQKAPPMAIRYATMRTAYERAMKQLSALSAKEVGDCVNVLHYKWERGGSGEIDQRSLKDVREEEPEPLYHVSSAVKLCDEADNTEDSAEEEDVAVEYTRL